MIKKNVNYVAPQIATLYFDVQNCFASGSDISSSKGLRSAEFYMLFQKHNAGNGKRTGRAYSQYQ